jgi:hypothetical protein
MPAEVAYRDGKLPQLGGENGKEAKALVLPVG